MSATPARPALAVSGAARASMRRWAASPLAFAVLAVAAAGLLAVGSIHRPASSEAARIAHLDSVIKCPSCEDLSLAQSDASSAETLKAEVATWVHEGWTDQQVENWVVAHDGPGGLLVPEESGVSSVLYVLPIALVAGAAACLGSFFWRRRRVPPLAPNDP